MTPGWIDFFEGFTWNGRLPLGAMIALYTFDIIGADLAGGVLMFDADTATIGLLTGAIAAVLLLVVTLTFFDPGPIAAFLLGALYACVCCGLGLYFGLMA